MNPNGPDAADPARTELTRTSASSELAPGTRLGPYEIVGLLDAGGMGEVYRARDPRLRREVAIKVLPAALSSDRDRLRRFEQEAHAAAALNHPNIVAIHDIGTYTDSPYVVMELLEGATIRARLRDGALPLATALTFARQMAEGLAAAHAKGIIHRDLKPENLFVTAHDRLKILDFGLAKLAPTDSMLDHTATASGVVMGTVGYMAPEQVRGEPVDRRADLFAFGAVLYEMLAGRRAFAGASPSDTLSAILRDEPAPLTEIDHTISSALDALVRRCLAKRPEDRFQSAADLVAALEAVEPSRETASGRWPAASWTLRRWTRARVMALGGIAVVAVGIVGWVLAGRSVVPTVEAASIVALPAKVYGAEEFRYLIDAIPATLSTHLAQVDGLETKIPPTSLAFEQVKGDVQRIAEAYQVGACVLSTVSVERERLVLDLQLVDPRTRRVRWSKQYEGSRDGYIKLVGEAADGLRRALKPESAAVSTTTTLSTKNSEAELAFRRGQYFANQFNNGHLPADFDLALASLKQALEFDPALADAAAEISGLYAYRLEGGGSTEEGIAGIEEWARRAIAINPRTGKAWAWLAAAEFYRPQARARKMQEDALRGATFGPSCSLCQTGLSLALARSSVSVSMTSDLESRRLDPLYLYSMSNAAEGLQFLGRSAEALPLVEEALGLEPDFPVGLLRKTLILTALSQNDEAAVLLSRVEEHVRQQRLPQLLVELAQHAVARSRGNTKVADALLVRIRTALSDPRVSGVQLYYVTGDVLPILAEHGKADAALDILTELVRVGVVPAYDVLVLNPHLEVLRQDPRLRPVLSKSRAQFEEMLTVLNEARARDEFPKYLEAPLADLIAKLRAVKAIG
jgi:tetratricopeptide (TPR) repeat protein